MRVLMISTDKGMVGGSPLGDVIQRHINYGKLVDALDIIVLSTRGYRALELSSNVHAYPTNSRYKIFYFWDGKRIGRQFIKDKRYDLIIAQDPFITGRIGMALKHLSDAKFLVHFHGDFSLNIITAGVVAEADGIRVMSDGQKEKMVNKGVNQRKIRVISTPVDILRFINFLNEANPAQKKLYESLKNQFEGKKVILAVGREDKIKDYPTFYNAIRTVREQKGQNVIPWRVGGNLPDDLEGVVTGTGGVDSIDLPAYYYSSYLTVLSSKSESFGKVLVEANACGKPVVATATTGAKEIIQDGYNGFLVPIGDYKALAGKILYLLDNPDKAMEMGENGRKLVKERFSDNAEKIINFWKEIVLPSNH